MTTTAMRTTAAANRAAQARRRQRAGQHSTTAHDEEGGEGDQRHEKQQQPKVMTRMDGPSPLLPSTPTTSNVVMVAPLQPRRLEEERKNSTTQTNEGATDGKNDFEPTEESEPLANHPELLDATVLKHKAVIRLTQNQHSVGRVDNSTDQAVLSKSTNETLEVHLKDTRAMDGVIRYGQTVALYSRQAKGYLGVTSGSTGSGYHQLAFHRGVLSAAEMWIILDGSIQKRLVGPAALKRPPRQQGMTAAVRVGHGIVLRNGATGGLLSVSSDNPETLTVVVQSYPLQDNHKTPLIQRALHHYELCPTRDQFFQFWHAHTPPCPSWTQDSAIITASSNTAMPASTALKHYGPLEQETLWIDHVIASLLGLETTLLSKDHKGVYYITTPPTSTTVHNLVNASLNTSTRYAKIQEFLNQHQPGYDHGLVLQALCQEVDLILKEEYLDQIESLEQKFRQTNLTLHQVLLELRHLDQTLTLLHLVVMTVQDLMGGALLNALWELQLRTLAGNLYKQKLLQRLWRRAAVPYLQCMHQWLHSGLLQDHYNEFMITTRHKPLSGDSWNRRFAIQSKHVVRGLLPTQHWQDLVLTVGKYWNAVRQCQRDALPEQQQDDKTLLQLANDPSDIAQYITNVHQQSSTRLLHLLFNKCDIERSLMTLKRYFLLDQGDFLVHFMDTAESELVKLLEDVSRGRTQHWLKMAVQLTDATSDITNTAAPQPLMPHAIRCYFADESLDNMLGIREGDPKTPSRHPYGQVTGLTGMLAFSLDFVDIPFPTSLVVSRRNLSCYQMLFRHVFYAKYIERRLVSVWLNNQRMKEFSEILGLLGPTFCLRQRMLHFIQNFIYYVMLEVIEPNWQDMVSKIGDQQTPDDLISLHLKFLERTLEDCLLTNAALFKSLAKVMSTCLTFSEQMRRFVDTISVSKTAKVRSKRQSSFSVVKHDGADKKASRKKQLALIERELRNETYQRMIQRHAQVFDDNLVDFMGKLRTLKVTNLCIRLDYNGYHSSRMSSGA